MSNLDRTFSDVEVERAVRRLALEYPDWMAVLDAAIAVAAAHEPTGGEFSGRAVVNELGRRGLPRWIPNLRIFVRYGLLEKSGPSSSRRAYYRMPARAQVAKALDAWRANAGGARRTLRLVAAGVSSVTKSDIARRAGDLHYEPRSWR